MLFTMCPVPADSNGAPGKRRPFAVRRLLDSLAEAPLAHPLAQKLLSPRALRLSWPWRFAIAPAATAVAFLVQLVVLPSPGIAPFVFFFASVAVSAWLGGRGPSLLAVALGAALANYYFIDSPTGWSLSGPPLTATILFVVSASVVALLCFSFRQSVFRIERTAQALRESEHQALARAAEMQMVLDLVPAAVWIARDPKADRIDANRFGAELLELARDSSVPATAPGGEGAVNFRLMRNGVGIASDDLPIQAAARRGVEVRGSEFDLVFEDGRVRHLIGNAAPLRDAGGRPVGSVGAFIDITERKRAEASLAESEARFRHLADALPQMVFDLDAEGRSGYLNEQWLRYTGSTPGDTKSRLALVHADDRPRVEAAWAKAVAGGTAYECEYRLRGRDGQFRWVLARAVPVCDAGGRVTRWFGTATDVHELKQTQVAMKETARLKDEFLAMLSHELRNPLAPITNSLYILERVEPGGEQARRAHEVIGRQTAHLSKLVNELLDATRLTRHRIELHRETVDLNVAVGRVVEDHRNLFGEAGVSLEFASAPRPVPVSADATRLAQVVGNLLHNAVKYTAPGGRASVRVSVEAGGATIRVRDDGVGIAAEMLPHLFEPFTQARQSLDRERGGLGLGLALVKGLVDLHGGIVLARSDGPGTGSEFVVQLPLAAASAPAPEPPRAPRAGTPRRVLVVEDNSDAASTLSETLSLWGHEVAVAHEGANAIECARRFRPEFILCDIGLPGMDGYELARAVRADPSLKDVRLIAVTGYALPDDQRKAREAGFEAHLAKPLRLEELSALLGQPDLARPRG
jgi:PAS domain S-box-containing protein